MIVTTQPRPTTLGAAGRRSGFTLLEVLLASAIGVMLLGAIYVSFEMTLTRSDLVREEAARSDLIRNLINRMANDIQSTMGPLPAKSGAGYTSYAGEASVLTGEEQLDPEAAAAATQPPPDGTVIGDEVPDADNLETLGENIPFQAGVVGTPFEMSLFVSRVPMALTLPDAMFMPSGTLPADVRKVTYYMQPGLGLCRQEMPWATAQGVRNTIGVMFPMPTDLIAPEVVDASFEYFEGGVWIGEWDGANLMTDGNSVIGPPRAIAVNLIMEFPERNGQFSQRIIRQVFAVRSANGAFQQSFFEEVPFEEIPQ